MPNSHTPTRGGETQHATRTPENNLQHATAHRSVLLYTICDVFRLQPEEAIWVGYQLDSMLAPLVTKTPDDVPYAVRQELLQGTYSRGLDALLSRTPHTDQGTNRGTQRNLTVDHTPTAHVTADAWAEAFLSPIRVSYNLDPLTESRMRHTLARILHELGCENLTDPRRPAYLPTAVRTLLNSQRA